MKTIKLHIDNVNYNNKPKGMEFSLIKTRLQNENNIEDVKVIELIKKLRQGYSVSPGVLKGGVGANNWVEQTLFMIDIDNNNDDIPLLTLNDAIKICDEKNIKPLFYYYTFTHTKSKPKYRLAFLIDEVITDKRLRDSIMITLISLFPQCDISCKNADRIFLGTNKQVEVFNLNNCNSIDSILKFTTFNSSKNLNRYSEFDLLDYMSKDNDVLKTCDNITYFKTCSICGHSNCLRYYHDTNSFYCFGANGSKGGTIIEYLMYSENMTKEQALNKYKELCNNNKLEDIKKDFKMISAKELQELELPEVTYYVENLLPQGLNLICSVPKLGKSWLSLQLCLSITKGEKFLGFNTIQSSCLYLALEDSFNRLKERTDKLLNGKSAPSNLYFINNINDLDTGLIETLEYYISIDKNIKVIIIDTLQKIRGVSKSTNVYANDYKELSKIKSFADKYNICVVLIHHLKKGGDNNDVFEKVSGTNGITGTVDTTFVLNKKNRNDIETILSVVGRDIEHNEYVLTFNKDSCVWNFITNYDEYNDFVEKQKYMKNTLVILIKQLVYDNKGEWRGTFKELNLEHQKRYNMLFAEKEITLKYEVNRFSTLLLKIDNIEYIPSKYATNEGRVQTFRKQK